MFYVLIYVKWMGTPEAQVLSTKGLNNLMFLVLFCFVFLLQRVSRGNRLI